MSWLHDIKGHRLNRGTVKGNRSSWEIKDIQNAYFLLTRMIAAKFN